MLRRLEKTTYNLYRAWQRRSNPVPALPGVSEVEPRRRLTLSPVRRKVAAVVVAAGFLVGGGYGGYEFAEYQQDEQQAAAVDKAMTEARVSNAALLEAERAEKLTEDISRAERVSLEGYVSQRVTELRAEHEAAEDNLIEAMQDSWR